MFGSGYKEAGSTHMVSRLETKMRDTKISLRGVTAIVIACRTCLNLQDASRYLHVPKVQFTHQYQTDNFTSSQSSAQDTHPFSLHSSYRLSSFPFSLLSISHLFDFWISTIKHSLSMAAVCFHWQFNIQSLVSYSLTTFYIYLMLY